MTKISGGSAALHGFLYQLLAHLDWAVMLTLRPNGDALDLILEPVGGGDAEISTNGRRLVEQYKTRQGGTWSIRDIVCGAIADFVRSAKKQVLAADEFRFITDGRVEHQLVFSGFLSRVAEIENSQGTLDQHKQHDYRGVGRKTDCEMFNWVLGEVTTSLRLKNPPAQDLVMHVLARTHLIGASREETMRQKVEEFLRRSLPNPNDAPDKTSALIGTLVEQLAKGTLSLNAQDFLSGQGIDCERVKRLASLNRILSEILAQTTTKGSHQYRPTHDVRSAPPWEIASEQILALTAPPGTGKSWQLLRLDHELGKRGLPCVYAPLQRDLSRTLDVAARVVWNDALATPTTCDMASLKQALSTSRQPVPDPWLVILIDGPIDDAGVHQLMDFAAGDEGIRFVVTVSVDLGQRLRAKRFPTIEVVEVNGFDDDELCNYLELHNLPWADIPRDLFSLLRLPLLASLYVRSSFGKFAHSPQSEYELFEALWSRVAERMPSPAAIAHLRTLARAFAEQPDAMSLAVEHVPPQPSEETLRALTDAGWLDVDSRAHVRFAHDRLLNWALADAVVTDIQAGRLTTEQIPPALKLPWSSQTRWGYVPMDALWKLCADATRSKLAAHVPTLLRSETQGIPEHILYGQLIPTLGYRAIVLLTALLEGGDQERLAPRLVQCVRQIARQRRCSSDSTLIESAARNWLRAPDGTSIRLGLTLIETGKLSSLADDVFRIHLIHAESLRTSNPDHSDYEMSFAALKSCIRENPTWIERALSGTLDAAKASALSWQLLNLDDDSAVDIWRRTKSRIIEMTAPGFLRGALACIRRFRDTSLIEFTREALNNATG